MIQLVNFYKKFFLFQIANFFWNPLMCWVLILSWICCIRVLFIYIITRHLFYSDYPTLYICLSFNNAQTKFVVETACLGQAFYLLLCIAFRFALEFLHSNVQESVRSDKKNAPLIQLLARVDCRKQSLKR